MDNFDMEVERLINEILNLKDQIEHNNDLIKSAEESVRFYQERGNRDSTLEAKSRIKSYIAANRNLELSIKGIESQIRELNNKKEDSEKLQKIEIAVAAAEKLDKYFKNQVRKLRIVSKSWFKATWRLALCTIVASVIFVVVLIIFKDQISGPLGYNLIVAKFFILSVLFSASIWSGNVYKTILHQISYYEDKSVLTETFIKFKSAGFSNSVQDSVLAEATRTIFAGIKTGYAGSRDQGSSIINIGDMFKAGKS